MLMYVHNSSLWETKDIKSRIYEFHKNKIKGNCLDIFDLALK